MCRQESFISLTVLNAHRHKEKSKVRGTCFIFFNQPQTECSLTLSLIRSTVCKLFVFPGIQAPSSVQKAPNFYSSQSAASGCQLLLHDMSVVVQPGRRQSTEGSIRTCTLQSWSTKRWQWALYTVSKCLNNIFSYSLMLLQSSSLRPRCWERRNTVASKMIQNPLFSAHFAAIAFNSIWIKLSFYTQ